MASLNFLYIFPLILSFPVYGEESWARNNPRKTGAKPGNFLSIFNNCVINIRTYQRTSESSGWTQEQLKYLKYFMERSPVLLEKIGHPGEEVLCSDEDVEMINNGTVSEELQGTCVQDKWRKTRGNLPLTQKRVDCYAHLYFLESIVGERGDFLILHKILEQLVPKNENPDYVLLIRGKSILEESLEFKRSERSFYSNLYRLTLTSQFLVIDGRDRDVKMVCLHCRGNTWNQLKVLQKGLTSLSQLQNIWVNLHQNMLGRSVEAFKYRTEEISTYETRGCGLYRVGLETEQNMCAILAVAQNLNMTPFPTDYKLYGHVKYGMMSYADYNEQIFGGTTRAKYEWLTTAEYFEPFIYITVVDKDGLNISALWRTFNPSTWAALISTFLGLAALFAATTSARYEVMRAKLINLRFTFVLFTAILLEQSQLTIWKVKMRLNAVSKTIIITWIFAAVFISSLYRGTVYSYLATSIPPPIPPTTKSLVESPYFLVTTTAYHFQGKPYSTLVSILDEMMRGEPNEDYPGFYRDLKENVHFIPMSHAEVVQAHKFSSRLMAVSTHRTSRDGSVLKKSSSSLEPPHSHHVKSPLEKLAMYQGNLYIFQNVTIPPDFAIIGSEFDVETLKKLMETFSTAFVQRSSSVHTFLNRTPWVVRRNFFISLFHGALAHLHESGIYARWRKLMEIGHVVREFQNVHRLLVEEPARENQEEFQDDAGRRDKSGSKGNKAESEKEEREEILITEEAHHMSYSSSVRPNYLALLFSGMKTVENHTLKPKPLSFDVFDSAFVFYILCSSVSLSIFLSEWLFFAFSKVIWHVERNRVSSKAI